MNILKSSLKQVFKKRFNQLDKIGPTYAFNNTITLQNVPQYNFSRFGSTEKKVEDLTKQLTNYSRKNNYKQMVMTQIKIIKLKEKKESTEFYPNFVEDYKKLSDILIKKRDYEEAITLYEDCIRYYTERVMKQQQRNIDETEQSYLKEDINELITLKLELANVNIIDPSKNGDEAFELLETLKDSLQNGGINTKQYLKLKLLESKLYYKTYELKESQRVLLEADKIIIESADKNENEFDICLKVEILTQKVKTLVELQEIKEAENVVKQCSDLIKSNNLQHKYSYLCVDFYHAWLELCEFNADFDTAQTLTIEIQMLLENSENQDPVYQAVIYYYDSLVMNQISNYIECAQSLNQCFNNLEKSINCDNLIVWKALNLKAILMIQENDFQNALKVLVTNKQELEKHNKKRTRIYFETLTHIAILRFSLTQLEQAKDVGKQIMEGVTKYFDKTSDLYNDALLIKGLCSISDNKLDQENIKQGLIDIREACMNIKNNNVKQLYIRVLCLNLLKEILKKKNAFKEIFYINTVLDSYYFQPRLKIKQSKDFITQYEDNCKQIELITQILNLSTVNTQQQ